MRLACGLLANCRVQRAIGSGEVFGGYLLYERLGTGGMAMVHRAVHQLTGREVALKRLLPQFSDDRAMIKQFMREAVIASMLSHPCIVAVEDYGDVAGVYYIAMELVKGQSVLDLLRKANTQKTPAPAAVAVRILDQVLGALDYAMTGLDSDGVPFKIVHRDLSPSNLIITEEGAVKIIDFGVARALLGQLATNSGRIKGKLGYMAPEVLAGRGVDGRSDLYSLAVVTWEVLTARRLFRGTDIEHLKRRMQGAELVPASKTNQGVPKELDALLAVALSDDRASSWPSAAAMRMGLRTIVRRFGAASSSTALLAWMDGLDATAAVAVAAVPAPGPVPPKFMTYVPTRPSNIPGVRRFVDPATVVEHIDHRKRHQEVLAAAAQVNEKSRPKFRRQLAVGSQEFPNNEQRVAPTPAEKTIDVADWDESHTLDSIRRR